MLSEKEERLTEAMVRVATVGGMFCVAGILIGLGCLAVAIVLFVNGNVPIGILFFMVGIFSAGLGAVLMGWCLGPAESTKLDEPFTCSCGPTASAWVALSSH